MDGGINFVSIAEELDGFGYGVSSIIKGPDNNLVYFTGVCKQVYWITRDASEYKKHEIGANTYLTGLTPHPSNPFNVLRELSYCESITCVNGEVSYLTI